MLQLAQAFPGLPSLARHHRLADAPFATVDPLLWTNVRKAKQAAYAEEAYRVLEPGGWFVIQGLLGAWVPGVGSTSAAISKSTCLKSSSSGSPSGR
jgi:hypothetical protein